MIIVKIRKIVLCVMACALLASCSSTRRGTSQGMHHEHTLDVGKGTKSQQRIVKEALTWVGTPYKYAGVTKGDGVDCSGMVMCVYETAAGKKLPRNSGKQAEFCDAIEPKNVAMGDLVFFATGKDPNKVSHVGIVVDNTHFVHASASKGVVVSDIQAPYYTRTFLMFGRVPGLDAVQNNDMENKPDISDIYF